MHFEDTSFKPALNDDATPVVTLCECDKVLKMENHPQKLAAFQSFGQAQQNCKILTNSLTQH